MHAATLTAHKLSNGLAFAFKGAQSRYRLSAPRRCGRSRLERAGANVVAKLRLLVDRSGAASARRLDARSFCSSADSPATHEDHRISCRRKIASVDWLRTALSARDGAALVQVGAVASDARAAPHARRRRHLQTATLWSIQHSGCQGCGRQIEADRSRRAERLREGQRRHDLCPPFLHSSHRRLSLLRASPHKTAQLLYRDHSCQHRGSAQDQLRLETVGLASVYRRGPCRGRGRAA